MAQKEQVAPTSARKLELVAELASARHSITDSKEAIREKLKPGKLVRSLLTRRPKTLFAGSVLTSLFATLLIKRPKKTKQASAPKTNKQILLAWLLSLLKPAAKAWLVYYAKQFAANRLSRATSAQEPQSGIQSGMRGQEQFFVQRK